jgi:CubicO group peptidase (beta-lactamase class C family)
MSDAQIAEKLDAYVKKLAAADVFSGAVLVARDGKVVYRKAFGMASQAFRVPNRVDTKFNLGSMNKMFTAVAIAQLAEKGKLSFSDTVGKHLPEYPNKAVGEKVTIHHLLTHTSGMGSYFNPKFMEASRDRFRSVADYLPLYVDEPLAFEPGARWEYSNSGFMLLGAIIEKATGKSYFDTVREQIYRPAGMKDTECYEMDQDTPNLAIGYTRMGPEGPGSSGPRRNNLYMHVIKGGPAGGGFSTVEDLARFATALREHRLLSSPSTETVLAGKVALPGSGEAKYAYGFFEERVNGKRVVGHGGGFPGINSQLDLYPELGYTVAVMSNYDPPAAQRVAGKLREMITQG